MFNSKWKYEKTATVNCVPQTTQNVVISHSCFAKKCTKIYKADAQLLFWSLNLLFGDILILITVVVVVVVCISSLVLPKRQLAKHTCKCRFHTTCSIQKKNCYHNVQVLFSSIFFSYWLVNSTHVRN